MSPDEVKQYADIVVAVMSAGGVTSILLAIIGAKKSKREDKEDDDRPNIGAAGMNAIGGMLATEGNLTRLITSIDALALTHTTASERSRHEAEVHTRTAEDHRAVMRRMVEQLEELNTTLKKLASKLGG